MNGFSTKAMHAAPNSDDPSGAVIAPIHLSTTFEFGNSQGLEYSRSGNPSRSALEKTLAALDGNTHGLAFSSGSAVLATVVSLLKPDESIMFSTNVYGGTYRYIVNVAGRQNVQHVVVDFAHTHDVEKALADNNVRFVWLETPSNPMLEVVDISWLAEVSHSAGAQLVVDNTFASPVLQQPAQFGADAVVYSTTKYINGHSDSVGGALTTSNTPFYEQLKYAQNAAGNMLSPFDSWLTLRGLKTLEVRMERHTKNSDAVVELLTRSTAVSSVFYPGLHSSNEQDIVRKQMTHPGAMVSFELNPDSSAQVFVETLQLIPLAESLGGVESLLDHPASMTHGAIPKAERDKIGLSDQLFRLSVGIENTDDLVADIRQALHAATQSPSKRAHKTVTI